MFKSWRRKRLLERESIADELWNGALAACPALKRLSAEELARLRTLAVLFLHEKRFEPSQGFAITDAMRVRISMLAALPILVGMQLVLAFLSYDLQNVPREVLHPRLSGQGRSATATNSL